MAKNYADIYGSGNVSIALEQRFYAIAETVRGTLLPPTGADFFYTLGGGSIVHQQPVESSPHRSGRHHNNIIKKKKEATFNFSTYFNINTALVAPAAAEIDPAVRVLFRSMFGAQSLVAGAEYTVAVPNFTFTLMEVGDKWAKQMTGCFVQGCNMTMPGDGEATCAWTGAGKEALYVGIGMSTSDNDTGHTVTLQAGEGALFKKAVGAMVMIIEANGTTRSADTPDGTPRKIVSVVGDVVTLDGAVLADADGSALNTPVYLVYYEPTTPVAIDNPVTGLVGSFAVTGYGSLCARSITINCTNDHEVINYCYGTDSLSSPFYVAGSRFRAELSFEVNFDETILALLNDVQEFEGQDISIVLGEAAGRRLEIDIPKALFTIPSVALPDTGSIPVTFQGTAYQTAFDAADEIAVHFA